MGEVDWCEIYWVSYQSLQRTIFEGHVLLSLDMLLTFLDG